MSRPEPTPLVDRLFNRCEHPRPADWLDARPVATAPLIDALVQELDPPDPLADPAVRARIDAARAAAEREGREAGTGAVDALRQRLGDAIAQIDEARASATDMLAAEIVELALVVARAVCRRELAGDLDGLVAVVEAGIASAAGDTDIEIKLHPDEFDAVAGHVADAPVKLIGDPSLAPGECLVESSQRVIDARVESRVDAVREGLVELLSC